MKRIIQINIFFIATILNGCTPLAKFMYGVKEPKYESAESIETFKVNVFKSDAPTLVLKSSEWMNLKMLDCPEIFVFNAVGKFIPYKDSLKPNRNGPAELFLHELDATRSYHYSDEFNVETFWKKFENPNCLELPDFSFQQVDFYIFTTWVNWSGKKIYKEKTIEWLTALKGNKKIRYQLYFVNQDFQECWSDEVKAWFENPTPVNRE